MMKLDLAIEIIRTELESACEEFYPNYEREDLVDDNNVNEEARKQINDAFQTILDNLPK